MSESTPPPSPSSVLTTSESTTRSPSFRPRRRPRPDPMLAVELTGASPRTDADFAVLTSKTGAELVSAADWRPGEATVCAIGPATADALRAEGYPVDVVPEEYTSSGLVERLESDVDGAASRSRGAITAATSCPRFEAAGAYVHESVLYRLVRPEGSGDSAERAAVGDLDAVCFTSSLTVDHSRPPPTAASARALDGPSDAVVESSGSRPGRRPPNAASRSTSSRKKRRSTRWREPSSSRSTGGRSSTRSEREPCRLTRAVGTPPAPAGRSRTR
ncbi:hypothetical protein D8S78_00560 [Natrialba swarupiae]|nr:hypothetical protein [Natrialba swarupiae]